MRAIDADALITELNGIRYPGAPYVDAGIRIAIGKVCDAPTIEERKTGKWIYKNDLKQFFCDQCGEPSLTDDDVYIYDMYFPNFCPKCGADMRGEQDGSD